ncbi:MAG: hypothetical protein ABI557_01285 [Aureliella sp.]
MAPRTSVSVVGSLPPLLLQLKSDVNSAANSCCLEMYRWPIVKAVGFLDLER